MKRIFKIIFSSLFISLITFSAVAGQEKRNEQKIKIIIDDGSGKKVIIDTLLKDNQMTDSLRLKDGKVIFIGHHGDNADLNHSNGNHQVFVTVSTDGKETKKIVKEITVVRSDSAKWKEGGETISYTVSSDDKESDSERTKYVINKDGMVITIEGDDYNKVKELVKEIDSKLDARKDVAVTSKPVKAEPKKPVKK